MITYDYNNKKLTNANTDIRNFFSNLNATNHHTPQIFVISDTHFGHGNIIKYSNRPFETAEEMNSVLINKWNKYVSPQDIVVHCGDFCLGAGAHRGTNTKRYREQLNGKIILILGNHDDKRCAYVDDCGFEAVFFHYHIFGNSLMFCHSTTYPPKDAFNNIRFTFYGHVHNNDLDPFNLDAKHCNVCVEELDFAPLNITSFLTDEEYFDILNTIGK